MPECGVPYKPGTYTDKILAEERFKKELERKAQIRDSISKTRKTNKK